MRRKLVLMSGYPGSGKSTLAAALAERLGFVLIAKDALLATIYDAMALPEAETERAGRAAWAVFWELARQAPAAVLDTNIKPGNAFERGQAAALDAAVVEVRCTVPPELAMQRYAARAGVGHSAQRFRVLTPERLAAYAEPIGIGTLLTVDTAKTVDVAALVKRIARAFEENSLPA